MKSTTHGRVFAHRHRSYHARTDEPARKAQLFTIVASRLRIGRQHGQGSMGWATGLIQNVQEDSMKKFIAALLTTMLASAPAFAANSFFGGDPATSRDKTAKGAVIGGVLGAAAGAIISNNRNGHSPKRGAVVG